MIDLDSTLIGGQAFRWHRIPSRSSYVGPFGQTVVELSFDEQTGHLQCRRWDTRATPTPQETVAALSAYLSLDRDLDELWKLWTTGNGQGEFGDHSLVLRLCEFGNSHALADSTVDSKSTTAKSAKPKASNKSAAAKKVNLNAAPFGLRILRQDLHETLFSFICSQNNNVKRIAGMIERLCQAFGSKIPINPKLSPASSASSHSQRKRGRIDDGDEDVKDVEVSSVPSDFYAFPTLQQISTASEDDLRSLGFGYRSPYVVETCRAIASSHASENAPKKGRSKMGSSPSASEPFLYSELRRNELSIEEKRRLLMSLHGIGRKVCDCILLFSLDERSVVPIDTHMAQIATEHFLRTASQTHLLSKHIDKKHATSLLELKKRAVDKDQPPSLLPKHHDALQAAFRAVFGDEAGWAHSFLFFDRLTA